MFAISLMNVRFGFYFMIMIFLSKEASGVISEQSEENTYEVGVGKFCANN